MAGNWLAIFGGLSIAGFIYLLLSGLGLNDILPKTVDNILVRLSGTAIGTTVFLLLYDISGLTLFGIATIVTLAIGLFIALKAPIYDKIRREYRKRFGKPTSDDEWICKKCGETNVMIQRDCQRCGEMSK